MDREDKTMQSPAASRKNKTCKSLQVPRGIQIIGELAARMWLETKVDNSSQRMRDEFDKITGQEA